MADNAFWISSLTAGTAVLASWVTSRGTARAARIQADASANTQRTERQRETRRAAYANFIEQAQHMGELYWKVSDVLRAGDQEEQLPALRDLRFCLRDEYSRLRHFAWIVALEGPSEVAAAGETLRRSTTPPYRALLSVIEGDTDAAEMFNQCYDPYWRSVMIFVEAARTALHEM
ncbi:hypothetical protein BX264_2181 [Streptomyces sp. 2333.5]|uniref:hypothetical protein n=1 Tax=unclassified Streptomyces TaxID=2593676 RepID=UPI00089B4467|nr:MULTISPECIES: hypothetical protein [unclassified Streptomyces]PJJ01864.1 hypothetical protein BX264_2181 [Streptomyces sp. 2333.5]SEC84169.1 hypothetical protein SAMN05428943_2325 [Streptomyces sp. 2314.4]SED69726.1 hypothetical protein SAMN05428942_2284 [Streptomyces sp. 2112.2]